MVGKLTMSGLSEPGTLLLSRRLEREMLRGGGCVLLSRQVLARTQRRDRSSRRRRNTHIMRFRAEETAVIDRVTRLVLPLMHHLVQQRVERLLPAMAPDVTTTHHDLGRLARRRG